MKVKSEQGMSLLEVLVVVAIFAILGILVTRSVILTLQGSQKSTSMIAARENLDYSLSIMERQIRQAGSITCPNPDSRILNYTDQDGKATSFSCGGIISQVGSYIASGAARLTNDNVKIMTCSFNCTPGTINNPPFVSIDLKVQDTSTSGVQNSGVSATTQIYLRNY